MNCLFRLRHVSLACLLGLASAPAWSTTYYVNSNDGNDANTGTWTFFGGTKPWKTLAKVNQTAVAGDTVKLGRGARWEETLQVKSGVTYEPYGVGDKPLIAGSRSLASVSWSLVPGTTSTYTADVSGITGSHIGQLFLKHGNGTVQRLARARHPNAGQGDFGAGSRYLKIAAGSPGQTPSLTMQTGALPAGQSAAGAIAYVRNGTYILLDYNVTGQSGQALQLVQRPMHFGGMDWPYDIAANWGYWLENLAWMLDSPGEWHHDPVNKTLRVWMPNGASPAGQALFASVIDNGIVGGSAGTAIVRDIEVRETRSHAVVIKGGTNVQLSGLEVNRSGGVGISITNSTGGTIDKALVQDSRDDGIWMGDFRYPATQVASNINLTNSTVRRAGRGYRALSAVMPGLGGTVTNNTVDGSSYIGILAYKNTTISRNFVADSCMEFDDCGGIYAIGRGEYNVPNGYALNLTIDQNILVNAPGHADGRADGGSSTKGIYMDDYAQASTVSNNFVMGFDVGYHLHFARDLEVSGNKSFNNRVAELWMQENAPSLFECAGKPGCNASNYLMGNHIHHNAFASKGANPIIWQSSGFASTSDFATFNNNSYASASSTDIILDELPNATTTYQTLGQWQAATGKDTGSTLYRTLPGYLAVAGAPNLVTESTFNSQGQGWGTYNGDPQILTSGCQSGPCMAVEAVGGAATSNGRYVFLIHTAQPFTVVPGKQYVLSFDARTTLAGDTGYGVLRNTVGFGDISSQGRFALQTTWQRYHRVLTATAGATARMDLEFAANGVVYLDNVSLVEAQSVGGSESVIALYNPQATAQSVPCPSTDTARCAQYVDAQTGAAVNFPKSVAAKSAIIAVWKDSPWQDADLDGVPNALDLCPGTPAGRGTDEKGCSIAP